MDFKKYLVQINRYIPCVERLMAFSFRHKLPGKKFILNHGYYSDKGLKFSGRANEATLVLFSNLIGDNSNEQRLQQKKF